MDEAFAIQGRAVRVVFEADRYAAVLLAEAYQQLLAGSGDVLPFDGSVQDGDADPDAESVLMEAGA